MALIAFIFGAISSAGSPEQDMAERFVNDWAHQDFTAMHDELSDSAQAQYSPADLQSAYTDAQQAATATSIDPGGADGPKSVNGTNVVDVGVGVGTRLFGKVDGTLRLPLDGGKVAWNSEPDLPRARDGRAGRPAAGRSGGAPRSWPGTGCRSPPGRSTTAAPRSAPTRSTSPARPGPPIPSSRRSSRRPAIPTNQDTGVSGLELAFNARLSGQPSGELLAVKDGTPLPDVPAGTARSGARHDARALRGSP